MRQVSMYPSGYGDTSLERRFTAGAAVPQNSIQTYRISLNAQKQVCGFEPMKSSIFGALAGGKMLPTKTSEMSEKKIVS